MLLRHLLWSVCQGRLQSAKSENMAWGILKKKMDGHNTIWLLTKLDFGKQSEIINKERIRINNHDYGNLNGRATRMKLIF